MRGSPEVSPCSSPRPQALTLQPGLSSPHLPESSSLVSEVEAASIARILPPKRTWFNGGKAHALQPARLVRVLAPLLSSSVTERAT